MEPAMNMEEGLVSVIIPTYERPTNLLRAIDSVRVNDYSPKEIIVVDDNGKGTFWQKETERILHDLIDSKVIRYHVHLENRNGSAARNTGFKVSSGQYLIFLDDDDTVSADFISDGIARLTENPEVGAVFSRTFLIAREKEIELPSVPHSNMGEALLLNKVYCNTSTWLIRRDTFSFLKGFDESYRRHQDYEFLLRMFKSFQVTRMDNGVVRKFVSPNIVTGQPEKAAAYMEYFLENFKDQILEWDLGRDVMATQYMAIARKMAICGKPIGSLRYVRKASSYTHISLVKIMKLMGHSLLHFIKA